MNKKPVSGKLRPGNVQYCVMDVPYTAKDLLILVKEVI